MRSFLPVQVIVNIILLVMVGMLAGCNKPEEQKNQPKTYYDLKSFIENQIVYLDEKKPKVTKTTRLDKGKETQVTSDIDWKKELELFIQADINKRAYRKSYLIGRPDSLTYQYRLKTSENLPVQNLVIRLDSATRLPVLVSALLKSQNRIYESEKHIELRCSSKNGAREVSQYDITGYQKLIFMDKRTFDISAKIGL